MPRAHVPPDDAPPVPHMPEFFSVKTGMSWIRPTSVTRTVPSASTCSPQGPGRFQHEAALGHWHRAARTAWFMAHGIRESFNSNPDLQPHVNEFSGRQTQRPMDRKVQMRLIVQGIVARTLRTGTWAVGKKRGQVRVAQ